MAEDTLLDTHTPAWRAQVWLSFGIAFILTLSGIWWLDVDLSTKGFFLMGVLWTTSSSFSLAKTLRDDHEATRINSRIRSAKTEKLLREMDKV